ncbi:MAG: M13 family metallopeptidase [Mucilaginibacter polytrichastri]|nr:M13 family metallopeptidase [Mucilaginibacter polytrichastri]
MKKYLSLMAAAALFTGACQQEKKSSEQARTLFFDTTGMNKSVKPGDDFFEYANGGWMKKTEIPPSESGWGSFYTLYEENQKKLKNILEKVSQKEHDKGSLEQKVGDLYAAGMDTAAMDKAGITPLKPVLDKLNAVKDYKELMNFLADGYKDGNGYLFAMGVGPDDRNSAKNRANFYQTGIDLPERDYYFRNDAESKKIRDAYEKYIAKLLELSGSETSASAAEAKKVLELEKMIAGTHRTPVELRDPVKNYNKFAVKDLDKMMPVINWKNILDRKGVKTDTILISQPGYYQGLQDLLQKQPIDVWKSKIRFSLVNGDAGSLSKPFRDAHFGFYNKVLYGQKAQKERWKTMVDEVDGGLGELLGQLFVKDYFPPEAKDRMQELVDNLQKAYQNRIEKLTWMSPQTKKEALAKLNAFIKKIGYPDKWKTYDDVTIDRKNYYGSLQSVARHNYKENLDKLDKPVDKKEWGMTPPTVNAYYNPSFNEIVFPAGILQFPFFDKDADDAINYGAIGAVIGHEMTHGFDDQGRQYDKDGNLKDWWQPADAEQFKKRADVAVKQYDAFTVLNNLHVNGRLTLGENLADIGGIAIAYDAFKLTDQGKGEEKINGFTPDQRFFLAFAQVWRIKSRDETMRTRITTDPHSPEHFRVNGPTSNHPAFYKAFDIKEGDKMYRPESTRVQVW